MTDDTIPLSPRHERFVLEFLKDGNATQAYIRAGYSARGAQPSASRLLRDPRIEVAVAAGRQRLTQALEVTVERMAHEYAKIAFASVDDFVSVDADGRLRIDLDKASLAQRAGILELKVANHRKQEQSITLKLGKMQALNALMKHMGVLVKRPEPGLAAADRQHYEDRCAELQRRLDHSNEENRHLQRELRDARAAPVEEEVTIEGFDLEEASPPVDEDSFYGSFEDPLDDPPEPPEAPLPPVVLIWPDSTAAPGAPKPRAASFPSG